MLLRMEIARKRLQRLSGLYETSDAFVLLETLACMLHSVPGLFEIDTGVAVTLFPTFDFSCSTHCSK